MDRGHRAKLIGQENDLTLMGGIYEEDVEGRGMGCWGTGTQHKYSLHHNPLYFSPGRRRFFKSIPFLLILLGQARWVVPAWSLSPPISLGLGQTRRVAREEHVREAKGHSSQWANTPIRGHFLNFHTIIWQNLESSQVSRSLRVRERQDLNKVQQSVTFFDSSSVLSFSFCTKSKDAPADITITTCCLMFAVLVVQVDLKFQSLL